MSKIRLYLKGNFSSPIKITKENHNYLIKVMRLRDGDKIKIFNQEEGEWLAEIQDNSLVAKEKIREAEAKKMQIILAFAPTKGSLEEVLDKAVQLGCDGIIPLISERSIIKTINYERCEKIILEATEQSGRLIPAQLTDITPLNQLTSTVSLITSKAKFLLCNPSSSNSWRDIQVGEEETLVLIIGPEGGFSEKDLKQIPEKTMINLGDNIMRAETGSLVAITLAKILLKQL